MENLINSLWWTIAGSAGKSWKCVTDSKFLSIKEYQNMLNLFNHLLSFKLREHGIKVFSLSHLENKISQGRHYTQIKGV